MEMAAEMLMLAKGAAIGYGSPQTLTDTGLKLAKGFAATRPRSSPPSWCSPSRCSIACARRCRLFSAASPTLKRLINAGLAGRARVPRRRCGSTFFYNALIFKKVQKLIGGRVRR